MIVTTERIIFTTITTTAIASAISTKHLQVDVSTFCDQRTVEKHTCWCHCTRRPLQQYVWCGYECDGCPHNERSKHSKGALATAVLCWLASSQAREVHGGD